MEGLFIQVDDNVRELQRTFMDKIVLRQKDWCFDWEINPKSKFWDSAVGLRSRSFSWYLYRTCWIRVGMVFNLNTNSSSVKNTFAQRWCSWIHSICRWVKLTARWIVAMKSFMADDGGALDRWQMCCWCHVQSTEKQWSLKYLCRISPW